jgi:phosphoribosylglycinamide formyltransferase-1
MRLLAADVVEKWRDRLLNIHPSLLPAFPGLHTHEHALAAGVTQHGATVHFVRAETDAGPIIVQGAVPVLPDDTPDVLAGRVLQVEHRIYPKALALVASGAVRAVDETVCVPASAKAASPDLIWPG